MSNERQIKRRIKSAKNISQITRAMQMVSASKMKRSQSIALAGRPYAEKIAEVVSSFVKRVDPNEHRLLQINDTGKTLIILISTNKGLLGGLNTNLFRTLMRYFTESQLSQAEFVTLGKKGEQFLVRTGRKLIADFSEGSSFSSRIPSLASFITDGYVKGDYKEVYVVYSNFISALKQEPTIKKLLPIAEFTTNTTVQEVSTINEKPQSQEEDFLIEPSIGAILDQLLIHYLENQVRDAVFEAEASEHSARMIAMKNATDNALEFVSLLTLEYNKARQEKITYEIADMITARSAFE